MNEARDWWEERMAAFLENPPALITEPFAGMTADEIFESMAKPMDEDARRRAQEALNDQLLAQRKVYAAMKQPPSPYRTPLAPYDYMLISNEHPYHPENPFNKWRSERQAFIDGEDDALERMLSYVRLEDGDKYDEVARA